MFSRWFHAAVMVFWLIAMSWLLTQKVIPPMLAGDPPDYQAALSLDNKDPIPPTICWNVEWNGRYIGLAASRPVIGKEGVELRSVLHFTKLPMRDMLQQLLGKMAMLVDPTMGQEEFTPTLHVSTRMRFDHDKHLNGFQTVVDLPELPRFIDLDATVNEVGKLKMLATAIAGVPQPDGRQPRVSYRQELDLPRDALVGDALSPRSELRNLKVGQQWTIPTYRPFPPNSPVQILLARVDGSEFITFDGEVLEALVVVYHDEAGSGLRSTRQPIGRTWVTAEGMVLKQEVMLSSMRFTFVRLPEQASRQASDWLEDAPFAESFAGLESPPGHKP